ncbi:MAG: MerR family transcriptional regulator [Erysipelothrix sp.]
MKTNDVEQKIGVSKQTLFYYENERLIDVNRDENGYRNYSHDNVDQLKMIKYLRDLGISIDDIRLVLSGDISFNEVLKIQKSHLEMNLDEKKQTFDKLKDLVSKESPLIPDIDKLEIDSKKYPLSYWKSTDNPSLGRKITSGYLFRSFLSISFPILILFILAYFGATDRFSLGMFSLVILGGLTLAYILLASDLIPNGKPMQTSRLNFVEFGEHGIEYYSSQGLFKNMIAIKKIIRGTYTFKSIRYEEIRELRVLPRVRYMNPSSYSIAVNLVSLDFNFLFPDGTDVFMYSPMMLNKDSQWIAAILLEKVDNIMDKKGILTKIRNGEQLDPTTLS